MESCIRISLSEYIDPDQSQRFDHSGRNLAGAIPTGPNLSHYQSLHHDWHHDAAGITIATTTLK